MRFADPAVFALLPVAIGLLGFRARRREWTPATWLALPGLARIVPEHVSLRARLVRIPAVLQLVGLGLLVTALARPQTAGRVEDVRIRGRNIMVVIDVSSSMRSVDFPPGNRLDAAKRVLADFITRRDGDLVGLVVFAARPFLQAPLTADHALLLELLKQVDLGMLPDGTAIGTALALALNRLKDLPPASSAIVLVTDGANNTGQPTPATAAEAARAFGIRIYPIGVSSTATATFAPESGAGRPYADIPSRLTGPEEDILRGIAARSGGQYFRATDPQRLAGIIGQIDRLERTEIRLREVRSYRELFPWVLTPAVVCLTLALALQLTWLRTVP